MLTPAEREKAETIAKIIAESKENGTRLLLSNYEIEWLSDKLLYCDDAASKYAEELQTANEELARRAEFD